MGPGPRRGLGSRRACGHCDLLPADDLAVVDDEEGGGFWPRPSHRCFGRVPRTKVAVARSPCTLIAVMRPRARQRVVERDRELVRRQAHVDAGLNSEAVTRAALERKESRGAQFREDYPEKNAKFANLNTIIWRGEHGSMNVRLEPLPEMPDYLKQVIEENA